MISCKQEKIPFENEYILLFQAGERKTLKSDYRKNLIVYKNPKFLKIYTF